MTTPGPLSQVAVACVLVIATLQARAQVDTTQWTCATCPYEKSGASGTVEAGASSVSGDTRRYGDFNGLAGKRGFVIAAGDVRYRNDGGLFANASAVDLGLSSRALAAEVGQEGTYALRLGYLEIPHRLNDIASTPFIGQGSATQTLPSGFPAPSTAQMPLATTLQSASLGTNRTRYDIGASWNTGEHWTQRFNYRHERRDGSISTAGSFFASSSQLVAPVDQTTDQLEISTAYAGRRLQASLAYQASLFRNADTSLTWSNPFTPIVPGATRGQQALAPDNQFHQLMASGAYEIAPKWRASGHVAFGRMTQDAAFLAATLNPTLAALAPALPATSLQGRADTFNSTLNVSGNPLPGLRVNASWARNNRENKTPTGQYPALSTDVFLGTGTQLSPAFSFRQDRVKLNADYRWSAKATIATGVDWDRRERSYQDVVTTDETTVWARGTLKPRDNLDLSLKLAHAERTPTTYGIATWVQPPQNPLLRKPNLADRRRNLASLRSDMTLSAKLSIGAHIDIVDDRYTDTALGLTSSRSIGVGAEVSYAFSEQSHLHAFADDQRTRSLQTGSEAFAAPDWTGTYRETAQVLGVGATHLAMQGKLELRAELSVARSRNDIGIDTVAVASSFPDTVYARDSFKLRAVYRLRDNLWLTGTYAYERQTAQDWHLDGIAPDAVGNLLALGVQPAHYRVNVLGVALRAKF
ncbi:MAG: MtrB/PioB family decaheme-associated outer membrane protein [Ideonella sp.]